MIYLNIIKKLIKNILLTSSVKEYQYIDKYSIHVNMGNGMRIYDNGDVHSTFMEKNIVKSMGMYENIPRLCRKKHG